MKRCDGKWIDVIVPVEHLDIIHHAFRKFLEPEICIGDVVKAWWPPTSDPKGVKGWWYDARIEKINIDGTYGITWIKRKTMPYTSAHPIQMLSKRPLGDINRNCSLISNMAEEIIFAKWGVKSNVVSLGLHTILRTYNNNVLDFQGTVVTRGQQEPDHTIADTNRTPEMHNNQHFYVNSETGWIAACHYNGYGIPKSGTAQPLHSNWEGYGHQPSWVGYDVTPDWSGYKTHDPTQDVIRAFVVCEKRVQSFTRWAKNIRKGYKNTPVFNAIWEEFQANVSVSTTCVSSEGKAE